jgi:hypothetical protein
MLDAISPPRALFAAITVAAAPIPMPATSAVKTAQSAVIAPSSLVRYLWMNFCTLLSFLPSGQWEAH